MAISSEASEPLGTNTLRRSLKEAIGGLPLRIHHIILSRIRKPSGCPCHAANGSPSGPGAECSRPWMYFSTERREGGGKFI
eukprot:4845996-Pyramimonas_sp.AAC.1